MKPRTRINCPICGMMVYTKRMMSQYPLKILIQISHGGQGNPHGFEYQENDSREYEMEVKKWLMEKMELLLKQYGMEVNKEWQSSKSVSMTHVPSISILMMEESLDNPRINVTSNTSIRTS